MERTPVGLEGAASGGTDGLAIGRILTVVVVAPEALTLEEEALALEDEIGRAGRGGVALRVVVEEAGITARPI
jgi:hypothetical protein